jgi:hypothetical protein
MLDEKNSWNYPGADAGEAINLYNQAFVDVVRASGGKNSDRPLICNTYAGCTEAGALNSFKIPEDTVENAIIAQVHFYQPTGYCFDMNPNQGQNMDVDYTTCGGESAADTLAMMLYKRFTEKGIPCIVGEFAASHKQNDDNRAAWADYVVSKTGKYGVKCFWWDNGGTFTPNYSTGLDYYNSMGIYNRNTMKFEYPKVADALVKAANGGVKPTVAPTKKPTATPTPTKKPTSTPKPTVKPTQTPKPTRKPGKRVKYSALDLDGNVSSGNLIP